MASALTREMGMMESQLNKWKGTADEALSLREKAQSLSALLDVKVAFYYLAELYCLNLVYFHKQNILVASAWYMYLASANCNRVWMPSTTELHKKG